MKINQLDKLSYTVTDNNKTIFDCTYKHEAEAFIRGVRYQQILNASTQLWTDYEKRFQVLIIGDSFHLYDMAKEVSLGEYETEEEAHDEKNDHIKEAEFQNRYENNSGR